MRSPQIPQITIPCSRAGPSRGGLFRRSSPRACAHSRSRAARCVRIDPRRACIRDAHRDGVQNHSSRGSFRFANRPFGFLSQRHLDRRRMLRRSVDCGGLGTQRSRVAQRAPEQIAFIGAATEASRKRKRALPKKSDRRKTRAKAFKGLEKYTQRPLDLTVRVEHRTFPFQVVPAKPTGSPRAVNSPRRALLQRPPFNRARSRCSSASLIVPLSPSSKRSLKCAGS